MTSIWSAEVVLKADPSQGVPLSQATTKTYCNDSVGRCGQLEPWYGRMLDTMNTAYCEVAVDAETGEVEILR
jgi:hypothetical protein